MTRLAHRLATPRCVAVVRKRRGFGLDAPRPPDPRRLELAVRLWLDTHLPSALALRIRSGDDARPEAGASLLLLLPGCRTLVLRLEAGPAASRCEGLRLMADCRARGIPLASVSTVDDVRAALRRLGIEPEES